MIYLAYISPKELEDLLSHVGDNILDVSRAYAATAALPSCPAPAWADSATPPIIRSACIISRGDRGMLLRGINPEANAASGVP